MLAAEQQAGLARFGISERFFRDYVLGLDWLTMLAYGVDFGFIETLDMKMIRGRSFLRESGDREPGSDGKLPPVGSTVDIKNATWKNTIGSPEFAATWTDPDFDPKQAAFYYARVIEIPTPRWTAYEAKRFQVEMTPDVPMTTQERAYTSPIWYSP